MKVSKQKTKKVTIVIFVFLMVILILVKKQNKDYDLTNNEVIVLENPEQLKLKSIKQKSLENWLKMDFLKKASKMDSIRYEFILKSISQISFIGAFIENDSNKRVGVELYGQKMITNLNIFILDTSLLKHLGYKREFYSQNLMFFHKDFRLMKSLFKNKIVIPENSKTFSIILSKERLNRYDEETLTLAIIHELQHIFQYLYYPNITDVHTLEKDAWYIQLECFKKNLSQENLKKFIDASKNIKHSGYIKEKSDSCFYIVCKEIFGHHVNSFNELFALEAYGYDLTLKQWYINLQSM